MILTKVPASTATYRREGGGGLGVRGREEESYRGPQRERAADSELEKADARAARSFASPRVRVHAALALGAGARRGSRTTSTMARGAATERL